MIRIESDGTAQGTHVYAVSNDVGVEGEIEIFGIQKIEFMPIVPDCIVRVVLTIINPKLDITGDDVRDISA